MGNRTEYMRLWREKNREHFNERLKEYRRAHPEYWQGYYQKNKERLGEKSKRVYAENKEKIDIRFKEYYRENADTMRARATKWQKENRVRVYANSRKYHVSKLSATPAWANDFFIQEIYDLAARRTKLKTGGIAKWSVDHIVPLRSKKVCGLHAEHNLRVIPSKENFAKHNTYWPDMP